MVFAVQKDNLVVVLRVGQNFIEKIKELSVAPLIAAGGG
jgi:hypothetical protein